MNLKKVLGGLCGIAVALTMFGTAVGPKAPFIEEPISFTKVGSKANVHTNGIEIKYTGNKEIPPAEFKADYSEVNYKSLRGEEAKLGISDGSIYLQADEGVSIELAVIEYYTGSTVFREEGKKMISVECGSDMKANVAYYVEVTIHFVANEFFDDALILSVNERGQLYFVESPVYKYNVEQFSYLKDSSSYTKLCLLPEKDMESDNYDVKLFADTICKDARTDYEKIDKIYSFIVDEMYYDYDQALNIISKKVSIPKWFNYYSILVVKWLG